VLGALAHSEIPFDAIVRELAPKRDSAVTPCSKFYSRCGRPSAIFRTAGTSPTWKSTAVLPVLTCSSSFRSSRTGLAGRFVYSTDLFDRATILRLQGNFQVLLEAVGCRSPPGRLASSFAHGAERRDLLVDWNDTGKSFPSLAIHELFEAQAEANPDRTALVFRGQQLTYAELNARSNKLAHYLRQNGAASGSLIGVYLERSFEMVVALLAF
jgi:non-ribosomal peptide synthetase component F